MKKYYYIEMQIVKSKNPYSMQSKWFKTKKSAMKWLKNSFDFIDALEFELYLMSATFDKNDNIVGDIEQEKRLIYGGEDY